ncbi:exonuclease domain-containing protein [Paenibacillus sp. y28]|uniref:exonuclease domain-containing protein n=1 Tax=Paenibacillus sp. y28 TaxID=3129110 RepID=UPI00301B4AC6
MKDMRPMGRMWHLYKMGGITPAVASMFGAQNAQQMAFIRSIMKEQRKNEMYEMELRQLDAVVFDLETTGFSPYNGDEIISIGAVAMVGGELVPEQSFHSLVNPKRDIPPNIEVLTGITSESAAEAPGLITVLHDFFNFVNKRILVCHGSGHDKHFLNSALWKTSKVHLSHRMLDCMIISKWLHPMRKEIDLDSLLSAYNIEVTRRHDALEDSVMTGQLWSKMIDEIEDKEVHTLGDLYSQLSNIG